jgi:chromosome partitioning protein
MKYDDPVLIGDSNQKNYFTDLGIILGNLDLMEFEHEPPCALAALDGKMFLSASARPWPRSKINTISWSWTAPQLDFLTISALSAATAILVRVHP